MFGPVMNNNDKPFGGTLVLGDLTIVQNHNFGAPNPQMQMMQMQQQMAIQQQQNQMLLLGMANIVSKQNKQILELTGGGTENTGRLEAPEVQCNEIERDKSQDVEFTIVEEDKTDVKSTDKIVKHMGEFFENNELKDEFQFNRFYKVEEDSRTFVIFIKKNSHNPAAWRKVFRDAYRSHQGKVIKTPIDENLTKMDAIYIAILFSTQGGKPDIIFIDKKENGRNFQISDEMMNEYVDGMNIAIGKIYRLCEPYIPETSNEISNYHDIRHPICHVRDTLFSNAMYIYPDM